MLGNITQICNIMTLRDCETVMYIYTVTPRTMIKQGSDTLTNNTGNSKCHARNCSSNPHKREKRKILKI